MREQNIHVTGFFIHEDDPMGTENIKEILTEFFKPITKQEVLKFMTEPEQRRAYNTYLESGNYNVFSAFLDEFQEGIFDTTTGKAVDLSEQVHESALRDLGEISGNLADDAANLSQILMTAKRATINFSNKHSKELSKIRLDYDSYYNHIDNVVRLKELDRTIDSIVQMMLKLKED